MKSYTELEGEQGCRVPLSIGTPVEAGDPISPATRHFLGDKKIEIWTLILTSLYIFDLDLDIWDKTK